MQRVFSIGGFHIYLFGITIALGILAGYLIVNREVTRKRLDETIFNDLLIVVLLFSMIGARLYFVLAFNLDYYLANPMEIFLIRNGGLSIQGGIFGGVMAGGIFLKMKKARFTDYADAFVPGLAFGQFIGRLGCDVYGIAMKTVYPWGVSINGQTVHPVQIYEALLNLFLFSFLWARRRKSVFKGQLFSEYIIGFSLIRGGVEFFRSNPIWIGSLTVAHVTSIVMLMIGVMVYVLLKHRTYDPKVVTQKTEDGPKFLFYAFIAALAILSTFLFYLIRS